MWTSVSPWSWGFPKGKINKDEPEMECAAREAGGYTRPLLSST